MGKKLLKFVTRLYKHHAVRMLFYISAIIFVLYFLGAFSNWNIIKDALWQTVASSDTLSLLVVGLLSVGLVKLVGWFDSYMEESMKIDDDHHKLITQYNKHDATPQIYDQSFADKGGSFLFLNQRRENMAKPEPPSENCTKKELRKYKKDLRKWNRAIASKNPIKDKQSGEYMMRSQMAEKYLSGNLCLTSINVFANVAGDTSISFADSPKKHELPSFVISHADEILQAHKTSQKNNSNTIRLDDFEYDTEHKNLVLQTSRSTYYHMLITNRCMDYKFANGLSIREIYEYENEICPLKHSKLGNQIGINGLIVTKDNYVLIEKRGRKKITWKNKFAQSISLAFKLKDLGIGRRDALEEQSEYAEKKIKNIIEKTINDNFGLTRDDYPEFTICENFLGIARDLLEGGKPNLYFYVQTKYTAKELKERIEENARVVQADNIGKKKEEVRKVLSSSKLDSAYYLVPFSEIEIDYNYRMFLDRRESLRVHRRLYPRCKKWTEFWDKTKSKIARLLTPIFVRECGEALLVTLAYMQMRQTWVKTHKKKEE